MFAQLRKLQFFKAVQSCTASVSRHGRQWVKPLYNIHLLTMATFFCPQGGHGGEVLLTVDQLYLATPPIYYYYVSGLTFARRQ